MSESPSPWRITLADVDFGVEEETAVLNVVRSKWLTMGPVTAEFEAAFARTVGAAHGVAVSNGTAALHLALLAAGVGPGDEVIVPSLTFVATVNAVLYCGATPVFADISSPSRLHVDPADIERKLTHDTKAILPMHYAGYPCDMTAMAALAQSAGAALVDDAAHAPGASWGPRRLGSIGDATCFSFFANKNIVTGEGGMVTTNSQAIAAAMRLNRSHGMTSATYDRHRGHTFTYDVVSTGFNYRPTEIQSALGLAQLAKLDRHNTARRGLVRQYRRQLADVPDLIVPFEGMDDVSSCHILAVVLPPSCDRDAIQRELKAKGIQTSIHYPPVHRFTNFAGRFSAHVPTTDAVAARLLTLPLHSRMSIADVAVVCDALRSAMPTLNSGGTR